MVRISEISTNTPVETGLFQPPVLTPPSPYASTLSAAPASNLPLPGISRPSLNSSHLPTPKVPPTLSEIRFLAAMDVFREFGEEMLSTMSDRLHVFKIKLQEITAANIEHIKAAAAKANTSDFWSFLQKVATCLLSAISFVTGLSLVATGGGALVGGALIASGILSIANFALSESQGWDWIAKQLSNDNEARQKKIASILPAAIGITSAVVGIAGSVGAFAFTSLSFMSKAASIAQAAMAVFEGTTTIGKGVADAQVTWAQIELTETKSEMSIQTRLIDQATKLIENLISSLETAHKSASELIRLAIRSNQLSTQSLKS